VFVLVLCHTKGTLPVLLRFTPPSTKTNTILGLFLLFGIADYPTESLKAGQFRVTLRILHRARACGGVWVCLLIHVQWYLPESERYEI
jgi:hypothetical protein